MKDDSLENAHNNKFTQFNNQMYQGLIFQQKNLQVCSINSPQVSKGGKLIGWSSQYDVLFNSLHAK